MFPFLYHLFSMLVLAFSFNYYLLFMDLKNLLCQVLLKPITYQLVVEPPKLLEQHLQVPTVDEVDESLVMCLGQMAVTARSDVLLKPLNHEVSIGFFHVDLF